MRGIKLINFIDAEFILLPSAGDACPGTISSCDKGSLGGSFFSIELLCLSGRGQLNWQCCNLSAWRPLKIYLY